MEENICGHILVFPFKEKIIHFENFTKGIEQTAKEMSVILGARQNETSVLDLNMRPKCRISTSVMAKIGIPNMKEFSTKTDKSDRNEYVSDQINLKIKLRFSTM